MGDNLRLLVDGYCLLFSFAVGANPKILLLYGSSPKVGVGVFYEQLGAIATEHELFDVMATLPLAAKQVQLGDGYFKVDGLEIGSKELDKKIKKILGVFRAESIRVVPGVGMQIFIKNYHNIVLLEGSGESALDELVAMDGVKYEIALNDDLYYLREYTYSEFMRISHSA